MLVIQHFSHCSKQKLVRQGEVKEREQRCFILFLFLFIFKKNKQKLSEGGRYEFSGVA